MKVSQLIKKLQKIKNQDAEVVVENTSVFYDGIYKATGVEPYDDWILISTNDHKHLFEEY